MVQCPACTAYYTFKYTYTMYASCSKCGSLLSVDSGNEVLYQPMPVPAEYSLPLLHKQVTVAQTTGTITGRLRYFYTEGYMNMWSLCFQERHLWLCESVGHYFVMTPFAKSAIEGTLAIGDQVRYEGVSYEINSIYQALGYSIEGELPGFEASMPSFSSVEGSEGAHLIMVHQCPKGSQATLTGISITFKDIKYLS